MTWQFLHRWYMPFAWITMSSLVAVPLAMYFEHGMQVHPAAELGLAYGGSWVVRDDFLASIVPYLLGFGCLIWLFNADGSTRWAAFWALIVASVRLVAPVALASMTDVVPVAGGPHYIDWHTMRILIWAQDVEMFFLGIMLWAAFGHFVGQAAGSAHGAYAEAH
jgi:hypothetical protein